LRGAGTLFVRNRGMGPGFVLERDGRSLLDEQPDRVEVVVPAFGVHPDGFRPAAGTARPSRARVLTPARSSCRAVRSGACHPSASIPTGFAPPPEPPEPVELAF